jgi:hypothetical protein
MRASGCKKVDDIDMHSIQQSTAQYMQRIRFPEKAYPAKPDTNTQINNLL